MKKKSLQNSEIKSSETPKEWNAEEYMAEWREKLPQTRPEAPDWFMTTSDFVGLLDEVCESLPWMQAYNDRPCHPEDVAISITMIVDTMSATINSLASRGVLKRRGQA